MKSQPGFMAKRVKTFFDRKTTLKTKISFKEKTMNLDGLKSEKILNGEKRFKREKKTKNESNCFQLKTGFGLSRDLWAKSA